MKHLKALVMMQLKDKIDFGFTASKQKLISKIVFTVLKFTIVAVVAYLFFYLCSLLHIFNIMGGVPKNAMMVIYGGILLMSLFSCTLGLMKTLYFADDNKILITLPVTGNMIFISRLIVYYVFELKRSIFLTIPIFLAFALLSKVAVINFIWIAFVFILLSALPVLVGAILSIPAMFIYRFLQKVKPVQILCYIALITGVVFVVVKLISLIPENIDLMDSLGVIQNTMQDIFRWCAAYLYPVNRIVDFIVGFAVSAGLGGITYTIADGRVFLYFALFVLALALLFVIAFFLSRPLFISMVSKSFEFEKKTFENNKPNKPLPLVISILKTECSTVLRSGLMVNFIAVYIIVPILIYLINKIFNAIDTRTAGLNMVYAFNLLLILLPILASNAMIATFYSRDGRAAYVKKTVPISPILPITLRLLPTLIASSISLAVSVCIFGNMVEFSALNIALLAISCIALNAGHMIWSASLDLMNPQNETYATSGEMDDNPNERGSTVIAFIVSALIAFFSFVLFTDAVKEPVNLACIKLSLIGIVFLVACLYMYVNKIKVYYNEK
ncbi:MAG: hypothetical protein IKJ19_02790 [Clostridia bacterium]|nr:hypothetical protein [Clostridia bacterium]